MFGHIWIWTIRYETCYKCTTGSYRSFSSTLSQHNHVNAYTYTAPACSHCYAHYNLMCHSLVPETARIGASSAVVATTWYIILYHTTDQSFGRKTEGLQSSKTGLSTILYYSLTSYTIPALSCIQKVHWKTQCSQQLVLKPTARSRKIN